MRKYLFALILMPLLAFSIADWVSVKLDNRVSVSFPSQPDEKEMSGNPVWMKDASSDARCMVMVIDFTKFGMDSTALMAEMEKDGAFEEFKVGILREIKDGKTISEKSTTTKGKLTFEYVIDMGKTDASAFNIMHNKNIFVGSSMYSLSFFEKSNKPQDELRKKFFSSFKLN